VTNSLQTGPDDGYRAGRRDGLALGALAIALVAFVNLLSVEKSLLAAALALLALRTAPASRRAQWALAIAGLHILTWVGVLVVFHDKFARLLQLLQQLG
jgi:hypothetical protein